MAQSAPTTLKDRAARLAGRTPLPKMTNRSALANVSAGGDAKEIIILQNGGSRVGAPCARFVLRRV